MIADSTDIIAWADAREPGALLPPDPVERAAALELEDELDLQLGPAARRWMYRTILTDLEIPMRVMSLRVEGAHLVTVPMYLENAAPPLLLDLEHHRIAARLEGHVGRVVSARWVSGHQILTAGGDGTARLWDGSTGQLRQTYQGGSSFLSDVFAF